MPLVFALCLLAAGPPPKSFSIVSTRPAGATPATTQPARSIRKPATRPAGAATRPGFTPGPLELGWEKATPEETKEAVQKWSAFVKKYAEQLTRVERMREKSADKNELLKSTRQILQMGQQIVAHARKGYKVPKCYDDLNMQTLRVGDEGYPSPDAVKVLQVIDESTLLIESCGRTLFLSGSDTTGIVDGAGLRLMHPFRVERVREYTTVLGASKHVFELVRIR